MTAPGNLFANLPERSSSSTEVFETLLDTGAVKIERIISHSSASPEGFWYDQEQDEWVLVLKGEAILRLYPDQELSLGVGDHLFIPRHQKHRVERTSEETLWLAVHVW